MKKLRKWIEEYLLLVVFSIWFILEFITSTNAVKLDWYPMFVRLFGYAGYIRYLLLFLVLLTREHSIKYWIIIALVSILLFITAYQSGSYILFASCIFIVSCRECDVKKLVRITLLLSAVLLVLIPLLSLFGILEDTEVSRTNMVRFSLGFIHPNMLGFRIFVMAACYTYLKYEDFRMSDCFFLLTLTAFVWIVPNSKTASFSIFLLIVSVLIDRILVKKNEIVRIIILYSATAAAGLANFVSVLLSVYYKSGTFFALANRFLTERLYFGKQFIDFFGISILGQRIDLTETEKTAAGLKGFIDSGYVDTLLRYGLAVYVVVSLLYLAAMAIRAKAGSSKEVFILLIMAAYCVSENVVRMVFENVFLVLLAAPLFREEQQKQLERKTLQGHLLSLINH